MKSLITGASGFLGSYLAEHLVNAGEEVLGLSRQGNWPVGAEHLKSQVPLLRANVLDPDLLIGILREHKPDCIYHLVGQASVSKSFADVEGTWRGNFDASRNLFEAVLAAVPTAKVLFLSSGSVYGQPAVDELPITEASLLAPQTPYAMSKLAADLLAYHYAKERELSVVIVRPFNQLGPRQQLGFAVPDFAYQIARLEKLSGRKELRVGDLSAQRDFTDVRDAVCAYHGLLMQGRAGEMFNLASGTSWSMRHILELLLEMSGIDVEIVEDPQLMRRIEPSVVRVDPSLLRGKIGWKPKIDIRLTLNDTLSYWRSRRDIEPSEEADCMLR